MRLPWIMVVVLFGLVSEGRTSERVAGLLNLSELFGDSTCERFQPKSIPFYANPSKERPPAGRIEARVTQQANPSECFQPRVIVQQAGGNLLGQELPTEESGYEVRAAIVYERKEKWFRIAFQRGSGWIERESSADFLPYPSGLIDQLTYLREGWDGRIWSVPGEGSGASAPRNWIVHRGQNVPVRLLDTRIINGAVWIHLHFETDEVCGERIENVTPLEGWLPAYRSEVTTSIWFYSRGC